MQADFGMDPDVDFGADTVPTHQFWMPTAPQKPTDQAVTIKTSMSLFDKIFIGLTTVVGITAGIFLIRK